MERAIPILPAEELAVAKTFYVDGLGFSVTFEASEDGHAGLLGLERGTIQLTVDSPMDGHGRNACVSLYVDDADAYYREWSAKVNEWAHGTHGDSQKQAFRDICHFAFRSASFVLNFVEHLAFRAGNLREFRLAGTSFPKINRKGPVPKSVRCPPLPCSAQSARANPGNSPFRVGATSGCPARPEWVLARRSE